MKLSQAILLGDTLRTRSSASWLNIPDNCGCALGGALLATRWTAKPEQRRVSMAEIVSQWPWLTEEHVHNISGMFVHVMQGDETIERIADYAASIEPPETCSECRSEQPVNEIQVCQECQP